MSSWDKHKITFAIGVYVFAALIFSVFALGCKSTEEVLKEAPVEYIYVLDIRNGVCSQFKVINKRTLQAKRVAEYDIPVCDGFVGLTAQDFLNLKTYIKKLESDK